MQPIPESLQAIDQLDAYEDDQHLLADLLAMGNRVRVVVPECVGLTLAMFREGISLTLVASSPPLAVLDGVQYLEGELGGGPCLEAVAQERILEITVDGMDEAGWQLFAQATAAEGIDSTVTLPIVRGGSIIGSVNMYASTGQAFSGHHEELAGILGAWAEAAITNADLDFSTRAIAEQGPRLLRERNVINNAVGMLMASDDIAAGPARRRLDQAATRAGITSLQLAEKMIELNEGAAESHWPLPRGWRLRPPPGR